MKRVFWAAAGVAVSWITVSWLGLAPRQVVFGIVLVAGLYLLMSLRRERDVPAGSLTGVGVNELLKSDSLPPEEAREWLDRFLVEQQDKK